MLVSVEVNYWAEGPIDRAATRKLIRVAGGVPGADFAERRTAAPGKDHLDRKLAAFNAAARFGPWLVMRDADGECAVHLVRRLLPRPAQKMCFRIVVPMIKAWFMADREALAAYMGFAPSRLPSSPEDVRHPKDMLVALAAASRIRGIREDFLPAPRSGRKEGRGYAARLIEFVDGTWDPKRAAVRAPSLRRALLRLRELTAPIP